MDLILFVMPSIIAWIVYSKKKQEFQGWKTWVLSLIILFFIFTLGITFVNIMFSFGLISNRNSFIIKKYLVRFTALFFAFYIGLLIARVRKISVKEMIAGSVFFVFLGLMHADWWMIITLTVAIILFYNSKEYYIWILKRNISEKDIPIDVQVKWLDRRRLLLLFALPIFIACIFTDTYLGKLAVRFFLKMIGYFDFINNYYAKLTYPTLTHYFFERFAIMIVRVYVFMFSCVILELPISIVAKKNSEIRTKISKRIGQRKRVKKSARRLYKTRASVKRQYYGKHE